MRIRPSSLYGIDEELTAWSFDRAVQTFGNALESKLQLTARSAKKQKEAERRVDRELSKWLTSADGPETSASKGRYADPALAMRPRR